VKGLRNDGLKGLWPYAVYLKPFTVLLYDALMVIRAFIFLDEQNFMGLHKKWERTFKLRNY